MKRMHQPPRSTRALKRTRRSEQNQDSQWWQEKAKEFEDSGQLQFRKAAEAWDNAARYAFSTDEEYRCRKNAARAFAKARMFAETAHALNQAAQCAPKSKKEYLCWRKAAEFYEQLAKLHPDQFKKFKTLAAFVWEKAAERAETREKIYSCLKNAAEANEEINNLTKAIYLWNQAVKYAPNKRNEFLCWRNRAWLNEQLQSLEESGYAWNQAAQCTSNSQEKFSCYRNAAERYTQAGKYKLALFNWNRTAKYAPTSQKYHYLMRTADCCRVLKLYKKQAVTLEHAADHAPNKKECFRCRKTAAEIYHSLNEFDNEGFNWREIARIAPAEKRYCYWRKSAEAYEKAGTLEQAIYAWTRAAEWGTVKEEKYALQKLKEIYVEPEPVDSSVLEPVQETEFKSDKNSQNFNSEGNSLPSEPIYAKHMARLFADLEIYRMALQETKAKSWLPEGGIDSLFSCFEGFKDNKAKLTVSNENGKTKKPSYTQKRTPRYFEQHLVSTPTSMISESAENKKSTENWAGFFPSSSSHSSSFAGIEPGTNTRDETRLIQSDLNPCQLKHTGTYWSK